MTARKELHLIHGKSGSGKTAAGKRAAELLGDAYFFSMGAEARAIGLENKPSPLRKELRKYQKELTDRKPLPAPLMVALFETCVSESPHNTVIVDGYPRYSDRLPHFAQSLRSAGARAVALYKIHAPDSLAMERAATRDQKSMANDEHVTQLFVRSREYYQETLPVIDALQRHMPLHEIDATRSLDMVAGTLATQIDGYRTGEAYL